MAGLTITGAAASAGTGLCMSAGDMVDRIEDYMGWRSPTAANTAWALARLNDGMRRFLKGQYIDESGVRQIHIWAFLRPEEELIIWPTATGTMTISGGANTTCTAAAAAFYPSMIGATLVADTSETEYTITAYTSSTVVTLSADASADDGDTFTVTPNGRYCLPSDFGGNVDDIWYVNDDYTEVDLIESTPSEIDEKWAASTTAGTTKYWTITSKDADNTDGQRWYLYVHPATSQIRTIRYRYRAHVSALTDSISVYPPGGADHCDAVLAMGMAEAERSSGHTSGVMEQRAQEAMRASVALDRSAFDRSDEQNSLEVE